MQFQDLEQFLKTRADVLARGPVAVVLAEDDVELVSTLEHALKIGFRSAILLHPPRVRPPSVLHDNVYYIPNDPHRDDALTEPLNRLIAAAPAGTWMHYCYNAEYLQFPFCERRTVGEMLAFHAEERRDAMLTYVVDLYATDLIAYPDAVSLETAHLDQTGYYAQDRYESGKALERQMDFFGGLRWRFEEHVPWERRRIDRVSLFRTKPGLTFLADHRFNDAEYNTYSCPWHHNLTAAVCSFRTAKALKLNPGSKHDIRNFWWHNSVKFDWSSRQLMELGLMEPGQWF